MDSGGRLWYNVRWGECTMNRKRYIDLLKTTAIFGVIVIHTCSAGGFSYPLASFNWLSTLFWASLVRASVPIFFMCSGALFIPEERELPLKKLYLRYILRILIAMFVWSLLYKIYHLARAGALSARTLADAAVQVLLFRQEFHFYYLHIILLFYAFLPVVRVFVRAAGKRELEYGLLLWFVTGILFPTVRTFPPFSMLSGIPRQWLMNMTYASIGYGVLGYYLETYGVSRRTGAAAFVSGFLLIFGGTLIMSLHKGSFYDGFFEGMSLGAALLAVGVFGLCLQLSRRLSPKAAGVCVFVSKASFCVYLSHVFFIYIFRDLGFTAQSLPTAISIPCLAAVYLALCCVLYAVLSKLPVVNRWLV
jgi:surface polysaccharide O-acyltransferase-like enzyme